MNRAVFASLTILCLLSVSSITGLIQVVKADGGTITINADGSITPSTAPVSTLDSATYTLTSNITSSDDGIIVERDNVIIDGDQYTVQGLGASNGINVTGRSNVTVKNTSISNFIRGIYLDHTNRTTISGNKITNNDYGIDFSSSSNVSISGNNITANGGGINLEDSSNNTVYHDNFIENASQVSSDGLPNTWDNGHPSGGNYWSDYNGTDANHDGIGDTPYVIDANNTDNYPLMNVIPEFPSFLILLIFFVATLLAVIVYRKKGGKTSQS